MYPNMLYLAEWEGRVVAGLSASDRTRLVRMRIARAPAYLRVLGALLGVLPAGGSLRSVTIRHVQFASGELESARFLRQSLRYEPRHKATSLGIAFARVIHWGRCFRCQPGWRCRKWSPYRINRTPPK